MQCSLLLQSDALGSSRKLDIVSKYQIHSTIFFGDSAQMHWKLLFGAIENRNQWWKIRILFSSILLAFCHLYNSVPKPLNIIANILEGMCSEWNDVTRPHLCLCQYQLQNRSSTQSRRKTTKWFWFAQIHARLCCVRDSKWSKSCLPQFQTMNHGGG